ncbi:hypothetical protein ABW20_dc0108587 [Dactylellina cionopaga]|nr:hypothetical protein ABW20_dc0108587 [Dactylellina cionopaga]
MVDYHTKGIHKDPATGLWGPGFQFGDWLDPSAPRDHPDRPSTAPMFVADSWLCNITNTIVKIATVLKMTDEVEHWSIKASDLVSEWQLKYMLDSKSSAAQIDDGEPPKVLGQDTQTAYALALSFQLFPKNIVQSAVDRLHYLIKHNNYHLATGFAGTPELLHAICTPTSASQTNLESIALSYKVLLGSRTPPSWLYPITMGATTIWERWDAVKPDGSVVKAGMTSMNHYAYGSVGKWIFENIGGIKMDYQDDTGSWKLVFDPIPNLEYVITSSDMVYESPKGKVECTWSYNRDAKEMHIRVGVPGNCEGEIRVLGKLAKKVNAGRWNVRVKVAEDDWKILEKHSYFKKSEVKQEKSAEKKVLEDEWILV